MMTVVVILKKNLDLNYKLKQDKARDGSRVTRFRHSRRKNFIFFFLMSNIWFDDDEQK